MSLIQKTTVNLRLSGDPAILPVVFLLDETVLFKKEHLASFMVPGEQDKKEFRILGHRFTTDLDMSSLAATDDNCKLGRVLLIGK